MKFVDGADKTPRGMRLMYDSEEDILHDLLMVVFSRTNDVERIRKKQKGSQ